MNEEELRQFISYESVAGNSSGNVAAISYLKSKLTGAGFDCHIEGQDVTSQPVLIAHRPAVESKAKILIYNHYDVEPAKGPWMSGDPFSLKEIDHRLYGRGIADNKGPLWARTCAFVNVHLANRPCPEVLWLIQGEEEIKNQSNMAVEIFKSTFQDFHPNYYIEETGYHDLDKGEQVIFLWSPGLREEALVSHKAKLESIFAGKKIRFKYEHLIKFASVSPCPFLANLPKDAVYVGFGPNDPTHNIHGKNESLDKRRLMEHIGQFESFLSISAL
jgi:acetylornithine deacetylase/succinyl-diaminopimelate desuccinylase-like protein